MFDIAPSEFLLVAVVALLVIGPKDLPKALRVVGKWVGRARRVAGQFRAGIDTMMREADLAEMEKQWAAENDRIMREHPVASLPAPSVESEDDAPTMVEKPAVKPRARTGKAGAPAETVETPTPKRSRKVAAEAVAVEAPVVAPAPKRARKPKAGPADKAAS